MCLLNELRDESFDSISVSKMRNILKRLDATYSFSCRNEYIDRLKLFQSVIKFPWRDDQKIVLNKFMEYNYKNYVIHAVFGAGKTTLLIGMLLHGIMNNLFMPSDIMFISFNVSIKNEIKRKLGEYGIGRKVTVRTFDSIVYEISKFAEYPYIDLPNYEGKRKFVYELCFNEDFKYIPLYQPSIIFIDECQDLERQTLSILNRFYPNSKFVFAGDIFQSIQKEPRESILWHYMTTDYDDTYKIYMSETPRVPPKVLESLKKALTIYYPEFKDKINNWKSGNNISDVDIEWKRLNSYSHIFEEVKDFTNNYKPKDSMILTFSSAITVRGAMGDLARIRRFLSESGIQVNTNHKKMDINKYFLSTANSSKGLERDYVIIFLTFPLERAFVHLSDDVVVNLITVALTRAKKKVIMYVPSYEDKFSRCLSFFENCPEPNKSKLNDGKTIKEFGFQDYIDIEHCVTELIRMNIIKYDTRINLKEYTKRYSFGKVFETNIASKLLPIITEEEKAFVGILIENLITSTWKGFWPSVGDFNDLRGNPMYIHVIGKINLLYGKYLEFIKNNQVNSANHFKGIYIYSQIHVALSNKIFVNLSDGMISNLEKYWINLKPNAISMKPLEGEIEIQTKLKMPWVTGVADTIVKKKTEKGEENELYELKASQDYEWKDNALLQIICYALMTGKTWTRLHLLNPFRNEKVSYYFDSKTIISLRNKVIQDVLIFNINAMMAKLYQITKGKNKLDVSNTLFIDLIKSENGNVRQVSIINMISPIKCELIYNKFAMNTNKKEKNMKKIEKMECESTIEEDLLLKEVNDILNSNINKDKTIYAFETHQEINKSIISTKEIFELKGFDDIINKLGYIKNEDKMYSLDISDSLSRNILNISYTFFQSNFC